MKNPVGYYWLGSIWNVLEPTLCDLVPNNLAPFFYSGTLVPTALTPWALATNLPSWVPAHCLLAYSPKLIAGKFQKGHRVTAVLSLT